MYRVVLISSKTEYIAHMKDLISETTFNFTVVSSYINSKRLEEGILRTNPHLFIVDPTAAYDAGDILLKKLRRILPTAQIIIYTAEKDFTLAKAAVEISALAYITPGEDAALLSALKSAKEALEQLQERKTRDALLVQLVESAKKQFLTDIFMGNITGKDEITQKAKMLSLDNKSCIYCPFWVRIPNYDAYITQRWSYDKERFLVAVGNFLRPLNHNFEIQNIMFNGGEIFYVAISETDDATAFINTLRLHLTHAERNLKSMISLSVSWHVGRHFMSFHEFVEHITTPVLVHSSYAGNPVTNQAHHAKLLDMYKNVVISAVLDKTPRLKEHLHNIVRMVQTTNNDTTPERFSEFLTLCMENMAPELKDSPKYLALSQQLKEATAQTAQTLCVNGLMLICRTAGKRTKNPISDAVERAIAYIQENFSKDLSLEDVAKYLNLNPSYFSRFFKAQTGYNFRDYVIDLRTKKAKELLATGKYKIYEISTMTGYKNSKYFAAQFKVSTGMTPKEFADRAQGKR